MSFVQLSHPCGNILRSSFTILSSIVRGLIFIFPSHFEEGGGWLMRLAPEGLGMEGVKSGNPGKSRTQKRNAIALMQEK